MLGKRKEREEDASTEQTHGATVFVSNLPYSATSTDLNTLFSDIGPVRSAFVVLEHETGTSKGVGYVSFAIREDAQLAFDKVNESSGEGIVLDGRKLRVEWAGSKPHKDRKEKEAVEPSVKKEPPTPRPPKPVHASLPKDPLAIRTIIMSGLPSEIDSKVLWKKVRKYTGAEKVEWPANTNGIEDASTAHVLFTNPSTAQEAVTKLHAHVYKGALLSVTLKKRMEGLAKPVTAKSHKSSAKSEKDTPAPSRASRLIVRNLPFDITEQDLRAVFLPYGPIHSIHIPLEKPAVEQNEGPSSPAKPRTKGYAFVWMLSKKDAEKALEGANGQKVRAGLANGLVRDKQLKKKLRREEAKLRLKEKERKAREKGKTVKEEGDDEVDEAVAEGSDGEASEEEDMGERTIAVDWALSKDKWEEAKAKIRSDEPEDNEGELSGAESDADEASDDEDSEDSHIGVHDGSSDSHDDSEGSDDESDGMSVDGDQPTKPQLPQTDTGTTLFVRNIPFEASEDELRTTFRAFGPLRYARITLDRDTGRSRGTGFVCFWNKEDADKAIEQSDILRQETTGPETALPKKNPFKLPSLLTPDPSASVAKNLVLQGRTLDVIRAVTRDEAGKLKEAGERQREKADKRNLYLLREGIILPNTPAAENLPQAEIEKRTLSFNARRALLRSNPSLYVSRTRLSIRQLPLFVTERMLKRLAIHAVRAFQSEVKAGTRSPLSEDELVEPAPDADEFEARAPAGSKGNSKDHSHKKGRSTGVKQTKIVRQQDRVDPVTGKGRSRGYGFLEMEKHADALRVLRWANNNTQVGKLFELWWKEDLEELVKAEKKKEKKEEGRLERLKREIEGGSEKKTRGSLVVEFSIENIQVVKRRETHQQEQRSVQRGESTRQRKPSAVIKKEQQEEPKSKKRRVSDKPRTAQPVKEEKPANTVGSLIGRKRKERKAKRKA